MALDLGRGELLLRGHELLLRSSQPDTPPLQLDLDDAEQIKLEFTENDTPPAAPPQEAAEVE